MFNKQVIDDAKKHAEREYPNESVGLVVEGNYVDCNNVHRQSKDHFQLPTDVLLKYADKIEVVLHSHPDGPYYPSKGDMQAQIAMNVPFGIVCCFQSGAVDPFFWGDQLPIPDLIGRPFRHGVTDCYSLIRDWFRLNKKTVLSEFPRKWWWWKDEPSMYEENFRAQGFEIIDESEVKVGDCFLAQYCSDVINHGGVYVGDGLILHQVGSRRGFDPSVLSGRESVQSWKQYIRYWVRYCK